MSIIRIAEILSPDFGAMLVEPMHALLRGYVRLAVLVGKIFGPVFEPLVAALGEFFRIPLKLQPHWRAPLILALTLASSWASVGWRSEARWGSLAFALGLSLAALLGTLIAGAVPLNVGPVAQGAVAAAAALPMVLFVQWGSAFGALVRGDRQRFRGLMHGSIQFALALSFFAGIGAFVLSLVPALQTHAALIALSVLIFLYGAGLALSGAMFDKPYVKRLGLRIAGASSPRLRCSLRTPCCEPCSKLQGSLLNHARGNSVIGNFVDDNETAGRAIVFV